MAPDAPQQPASKVSELDLTAEPVPTAGVEPPEQLPVQIQRIREGYRGVIAVGLLVLISGVVLGAFATIALNWTSQQLLKDLLTAILNPLIGLFGAVIGFYFGTIGQDHTGVETTPPKSGSPK